MAITYKGNVTVFGAPGTDNITGNGYRKQQRHTRTINSEPDFVLKDTDGEVIGLGKVELMPEMEITFVPVSTSAANALTALTEPAAIAKVVLSSFQVSGDNGTYTYIGLSRDGSNETPANFTLRLRQYPNVDMDASLS